MHAIDYGVVAAYLAVLAVMGVVLARRAGRTSEHYFLGANSMPWWALGASGMASNLDIAGTMTLVALVHRYGMHGLFIEFRGGVVLPIAIFLAFMGKWHRRSAVMTSAEWMLLRFGDGAQGRLARFTAALTYLVITVAMIVFFFTAGGRFLAEMLPFTALQCTLAMALVAFGYTLLGGIYAVVWTDVIQALLIGAAAICVAVVAAQVVTPELLAAWPGAGLNTWVPRWSDPALDPYEPFGWFLVIWLGKGVLEGLGGSPGSAYMAQRFYAARSDAECQRIGMLWTVLFAFRWPMMLGFALLAIQLGLDATSADASEAVLPRVLLSDYFAPGVRGLLVAALLAAAMSTFDSTINAGAAYLVRDIYQPLRPQASPRALVWAGYAASGVIVATGLGIALAAGASVLSVWVNIVMLLFPAFLVPFALRWFWARLNGLGFSVGILAGFAAALAVHLADPPAWNEAMRFVAIVACSLAGSLGGTALAPGVPETTLREFYQRVGPFGTWPPAWRAKDKSEHRGDVMRALVALVWQVLTFLLPLGMVLGRWREVAIAGAVWALLLAWLAWDLRSAHHASVRPAGRE